MQLALQDVIDFHEKMEQPIGDPSRPDLSVNTQLRWDLIHEEFEELTLALKGKDKHGKDLTPEEQVVQVADALGDIAYVVVGAAVTWGIDLGSVWDVIHASNMTKTPGNKRADGKILKGLNYSPPEIAQALLMAKVSYEAQKDNDREDRWWPTSTVKVGIPISDLQSPEDFQEKLTDAAKQAVAIRRGMQEIPRDANFLPPELASKLLEEANEPRDTKPTPVECQIDHYHGAPGLFNECALLLQGTFLARGAFLFDCKCSRQHEISLLLGSRGGRAKTGHTECMCGLVYDVEFSVIGNQEICTAKITDLGGPGANQ